MLVCRKICQKLSLLVFCPVCIDCRDSKMIMCLGDTYDRLPARHSTVTI
jgi:hypothetical protein